MSPLTDHYSFAVLALSLTTGISVLAAQTNQIFDLGKVWHYETNNLD